MGDNFGLTNHTAGQIKHVGEHIAIQPETRAAINTSQIANVSNKSFDHFRTSSEATCHIQPVSR